MILYGPKEEKKISSEKIRHSVEREPPLSLYIGLNVHSLVRSKKLIEEFLPSWHYSISYDRVMQIEKDIYIYSRFSLWAVRIKPRSWFARLVCEWDYSLKVLWTISTMILLPQLPSLPFHGTGISITQFPTADDMGTAIDPVATVVATKGVYLTPTL